MTTESLDSVDQAAYDQAEATVIALLRSAAPNLDLRKGTVLREFVVRPCAAFHALDNARYEHAQIVGSLQAIADNPGAATADDVNNILSNFNTTMRVGAVATGTARVYVAYNQLYYIPENFVLATGTGSRFRLASAYAVAQDPAEGQLQLFTAGDGAYYFLLPVIAEAVGAEYNLSAGTALNAEITFDGFITASAHATFSGGTDPETVATLLTRLPAAVSHRSLESQMSIESILRSPDHGAFGNDLIALSVRGNGHKEQLRDKHNAQGVAMGGKVDIYPRTFSAPATVVLQKTGTLIAPNTYQFIIEAADAPGFYAVRAVTDAESEVAPSMAFNTLPALGSYAILDVRSAVGLADTHHDFDAGNAVIETAYTQFQKAVITVQGVSDATAAQRVFRVELYVAPRLADIQAYVDGNLVRNLKADHVVRCPLLCLVGVRARVIAAAGAAVDTVSIRQQLAAYINSRSFVNQLTESELLAILHSANILRVDTSSSALSGFSLLGLIRDAAGIYHTLRGPSLDISAIADPSVLLTPSTVVFAADPADITVTVAREAP